VRGMLALGAPSTIIKK